MAKQLPPLDKLTKAQRKSIYKKVLKAACEDERVIFGWCFYFRKLIEKLYGISYFPSYLVVKTFPEFAKLETFRTTENWDDYWWPTTAKGWQKRIKLFHNMIETM